MRLTQTLTNSISEFFWGWVFHDCIRSLFGNTIMTEYLIARILVRDKIEESPYLQPLLVSFLFTNDSTKQLNDFTKATENGAVQTHAFPSVSMKKLARMRARTRAKIQNLNKQISIYSEPIPEIEAKLKQYRRDATEAKKTNNESKWRTATIAVRRLNRTLASKTRFIKIKQGKIKKLEEELKQAQAAIRSSRNQTAIRRSRTQEPQEEEQVNDRITSVSYALAQPFIVEETDEQLDEELKTIEKNLSNLRINFKNRFQNAKILVIGADYHENDSTRWSSIDPNYIGVGGMTSLVQGDPATGDWNKREYWENFFQHVRSSRGPKPFDAVYIDHHTIHHLIVDDEKLPDTAFERLINYLRENNVTEYVYVTDDAFKNTKTDTPDRDLKDNRDKWRRRLYRYTQDNLSSTGVDPKIIDNTSWYKYKIHKRKTPFSGERKTLRPQATTTTNVTTPINVSRVAGQTTAEPINSLQTVGNTLMKTKRPHQTSTGSTPRPSNCVTEIILV